MKYDFLQSDLSAGELSPSAQGHVDSDAYKAGLKLADNMVLTRVGSAESRAGGHFMADGFNAGTGLADNIPVQHIPIHDSPFGSFVIEISQHTMRFMDKFGVRDWNLYYSDPKLSMFQFSVQDGANAWGDPDTRSVYISNLSGVGSKNYSLTRGTFTGSPNLIPNGVLGGFPAGTNGHWRFSGKIAGGIVTVEFRNDLGALIQSTNITGQDSSFSIDFNPVASDFSINLKTVNNTVTTAVLFEMKLEKNATQTSFNLNFTPTSDAARIRAVSFWTSADKPYKGNIATYWIAFAGGFGNFWAGRALSWTAANGGTWTFGQLPCDADSLALIQGSTDLAVYQDRLWFGNNVASGRPQLIASSIGFLKAFSSELTGGGTNTQLTRFVFKVFKYTYTVVGAAAGVAAKQETVDAVNNPAGGPATGSVRIIRFDFPGRSDMPDPSVLPGATGSPSGNAVASNLTVKVNGVLYKVLPAPRNLIATAGPGVDPVTGTTILGQPECWAAYPSNLNGAVPNPGLSAFYGEVFFDDSIGGGLPVGAKVEFSTVPLADDPLNLTLASPAGNISWMEVLRGLVLGTTQNEKLFSPDATLNDESNLGADAALNALVVNDKIIFAQQGRQILRMANISFTTQGGLVAEEIGVLGEHLTSARIRSMCFMKTPVQRVVAAFDDGTGGVMTLGGKAGAAWTRFNLPAIFGGIYSVAALDGASGTELWVGTENGVTLHWRSLSSSIIKRQYQIPQVAPLANVKVSYDFENPLPPVMDCWIRAGLSNNTGQQVVNLSSSMAGRPVYALINGQLVGPIVAVAAGADPSGTCAITFPAGQFATTWIDSNGVLRPQEVYVGLAYPRHKLTTLPLEGGNPTGTSQSRTSRKVQLYVRFVDSYLPNVNGAPPEERADGGMMDMLAARFTDDIRCTELSFQRAAVVDIEMTLPLRFEVAALFGGTMVSNI